MVKNTFIAIRWIVCGLVFLSTAQSSMAMDPEGCLTCHQYPGLTTWEKNDGIKILHINEAKYLKSSHGRFSCRACHAVVVKIPHTGATQVECAATCHLSEEEKRRVERTPLNRFHSGEQSAIAELQDDSSCRVCHPLYPHKENNMVRALLNMHTGFMTCEVCHLNRQNFSSVYYDWTGAEIAQFTGDPYGTYYNPKLQKTHQSKNFISRISVFILEEGKKYQLMDVWDTAGAKEFVRIEKNLGPDESKKRLVFFHRDINRKEISLACDECHSAHSILDFDKLGFDDKTKNNLINLNIKGLVTKYKTFYFPQLFDN